MGEKGGDGHLSVALVMIGKQGKRRARGRRASEEETSSGDFLIEDCHIQKHPNLSSSSDVLETGNFFYPRLTSHKLGIHIWHILISTQAFFSRNWIKWHFHHVRDK